MQVQLHPCHKSTDSDDETLPGDSDNDAARWEVLSGRSPEAGMQRGDYNYGNRASRRHQIGRELQSLKSATRTSNQI